MKHLSSSETVKLLFAKYAEGTLTRQETAELAELMETHTHDEILDMLEPFTDLMDYPAEEDAAWQAPVWMSIQADMVSPVVYLSWYRRPVYRYAAAAVVILAFGVATWIFTHRPAEQPQVIAYLPDTSHAIHKPADTMMKKPTHVAQKKAAHKEPLACGLKIPDQPNGVVHMKVTEDSITMSIPRSWQYSLTLPDGTKVLLNASSSISYPRTFSGDDREVRVTGEAYFVIASDSSKPFYVSTKGRRFAAESEQFNINAYKKEVLVSNENYSKVWTTGYFAFRNESLKETMNELARWYDWRIVYSPQSKKSRSNVSGGFCRLTSEKDALKEIESLGISFLKDGNSIIIL